MNKTDLERITQLWDNIIIPACEGFEKETGKPSSLFYKAITGGIGRWMKKVNPWNKWQTLWWSRTPEIHDHDLLCKLSFIRGFPPLTRHTVAKLHDLCHKEYQEKVEELGSNNAVADWLQECDYGLEDLDVWNLQQDTAQRVVHFKDEFTSLVSSVDLIRLLRCQFTCLLGGTCCM